MLKLFNGNGFSSTKEAFSSPSRLCFPCYVLASSAAVPPPETTKAPIVLEMAVKIMLLEFCVWAAGDGFSSVFAFVLFLLF